MYGDKEGKVAYQFLHRIIGYLISSVIMLVCAYVSPSTSINVWMLFLVAGLEFSMNALPVLHGYILETTDIAKSKWFLIYFPIPFFEMQKRLSIFLLIAMGESIIAILTTSLSWDKSNTKDVYIVTLFGTMLIFMMAMYYYDSVNRFETDAFTSKLSVLMKFVYVTLHFITAVFILLISAGLFGALLSNGYYLQVASTQLGVGICGALFCMQLMTYIHDGSNTN